MGERGPAPDPPKLKVLRGTERRDRRRTPAPTPAAGYPPMPRELSDPERRIWRRIRRAMEGIEVITIADQGILVAYVSAEARHNHARGLLIESGPLIRGARRGELVKNPLVQVVRDTATLMIALARELQLTPAARARASRPADVDQDPFEAFLAAEGDG